MHRWLVSLALALTFALGAPLNAEAQRRIQYDTLADSTPAAISCGFCAGEKFGMVFRPLSAGRGLRPEDFPLNLNSLEIAVARTQVTGSIGAFTCMGAGGGTTVTAEVEAYAGMTPPTGSILGQPSSGPWPGETELVALSQELTLSTENPAGSEMYEVMFNTLALDGVRVDPPNTYIRVSLTIPTGGSSASCDALTLTGPGAVGLRDDDAPIANEVAFIYAVNPVSGVFGPPTGWYWNEDPTVGMGTSGTSGINGDWAIRMNVTPLGGVTPTDAGPPMSDAGMSDAGASDAGTPLADAGTESDAGNLPGDAAPPTGCTMDNQCGGGEVCTDGICRRVACAAASDCAGGMTCVDSVCRNLCSGDSDCGGGEVCDTTAGSCVPVGSLDDGGCGCHAVGTSRTPPAWALPFLALLFLRRRR
ncbi:MAG: MYXO-CTERM sorting domain-containing protein [Sandaracinaceae bacterium]